MVTCNWQKKPSHIKHSDSKFIVSSFTKKFTFLVSGLWISISCVEEGYKITTRKNKYNLFIKSIVFVYVFEIENQSNSPIVKRHFTEDFFNLQHAIIFPFHVYEMPLTSSCNHRTYLSSFKTSAFTPQKNLRLKIRKTLV